MPEPYDLVVRARAVVTGGEVRSAAVAVRDGIIRSIGPFDAALAGVIEVELEPGTVLIPGVVDTHVHVNEPGRTDWEGFASATRAAAAGGVTTIIDMPLNSIPPTTTPGALELKRGAAAPQALINIGFWGGAIPENLGTLESLHVSGVFGFKAFLSPSGVDEFPALSTGELFAAAKEIAAFGGLLIVHAEDPAVLDRVAGERDPGAVSDGRDYREFVDSRPESAEWNAIATVIEAVRETGVRAHILHLSSAAALAEIRAAKEEGLPITVETCPHYLTFAAETIGDGQTQFKCCPPIRDENNRALLWEALEDGSIDLIASDHSPATRALKLGFDGDFDRAWGGISGLQLSLPAVWTGARDRGIPLETVSSWMSEATARFAGLAAKGRIEVGADADLVAFNPDQDFTVDAATLAHKNPVSAFDGTTLYGRVLTTWLSGRQVYSRAADGQATWAEPIGELLASTHHPDREGERTWQ